MFRVAGVTAGYGAVSVLRGVDLCVPDGSVVALLGANGAGKTTLLRVASGLLRPTAGQLILDGEDLVGTSVDHFARAGICHIPEGRGIFKTMSVRENLLMQSTAGAEDESLERAVEAFPRLGERMEQQAGTMSGGEQQMLAVTRAYLANPALVLLDEVSLGLAPVIVDEIFEFFGRLRSEGASLLIVEQYVARALAIADLVYLMSQGKIVFAGERHEVDETEIFNSYVGAAGH